MQKNSLRAVAAMTILFSTVLLGACAPKFVGEAAAKEAGLTLLRQAFGTNAKDAHVEYFERAGTSAVDNTEVQPGSKTPTQIYLVTISDQTLGTDLYYAEVDAKTGVAYYASKNEWLFTPATNQQNSNHDTNSTSETETIVIQDDGTKALACNWMKRCFQKEVALISADGCCQRDCTNSARASIGYFVTFADGSLYRVGFSWPAMDLNEVQVLEDQ